MKEKIVDALKELGIKEVILEDEDGDVRITFASDDGNVILNNKDFSEAGL